MQRAYCGLLQLGVHRKPTDGPLLRASAGAVKERLYVLLRGDWGPLSLSQATARLQFVYQQVAQAGYPALDVRVLLPGGGPDAPELEALLGPDGADDELATINEAREGKGLGLLGFVRLSSEACAAAPPAEAAEVVGADYVPTAEAEPPRPFFEHVCLGGTFDYMHTGHKLLLSMGCTDPFCSMRPAACALRVPCVCPVRVLHGPCTRPACALHVLCIAACACPAHALHTPCTRTAHALHMHCTCTAHAPHMHCTCTAHALQGARLRRQRAAGGRCERRATAAEEGAARDDAASAAPPRPRRRLRQLGGAQSPPRALSAADSAGSRRPSLPPRPLRSLAALEARLLAQGCPLEPETGALTAWMPKAGLRRGSRACPQSNSCCCRLDPPRQDGYGPAGSDAALQAIVVSAESLRGGHACNTKRHEAGLTPLEVLCLPLVDEAGGGGEVRQDAKPSLSASPPPRSLHPLHLLRRH